MAKAFSYLNVAKKFGAVPLSHQTVSRRIEEIDNHVCKKLFKVFEECSYFSLCLDDSCDITDVSQLLIFIRTVQSDFTVHEELFNLAYLHGTTKGIDIYNELKKSVLEFGGFAKCSCIVTDGAKAMVGNEIGLKGLLRKDGVLCPMVHCIIHQEALCGKTVKLSNAMKVVVKVTNLIRGGNKSLLHRKFLIFLDEIEAAYGDLLLHSNIRWLSAGKCLIRFFALRQELPLFLKEEIKSDTTELEEKLLNPDFLCELAFLTDITGHLNDLNMKLQGKNKSMSNMYGDIIGFRKKLNIFKVDIENNILTHFQACNELAGDLQDFISVKFSDFATIMEELIVDFNSRFTDFELMKNDMLLFSNPFAIPVENYSTDLQLELCDLQADIFLNIRKEISADLFKLFDDERFQI